MNMYKVLRGLYKAVRSVKRALCGDAKAGGILFLLFVWLHFLSLTGLSFALFGLEVACVNPSLNGTDCDYAVNKRTSSREQANLSLTKDTNLNNLLRQVPIHAKTMFYHLALLISGVYMIYFAHVSVKKENRYQMFVGFGVSALIVLWRSVASMIDYPKFLPNSALPHYLPLIQVIISGSSIVTYVLFAVYLMRREFGWKLLNEIGGNNELEVPYNIYQTLSSIIITDFQFVLSFCMLFGGEINTFSDGELAWICILAILTFLLVGLVAEYGIRRENRAIFALSFAFNFAAPVYYVYKVVQLFAAPNIINDMRFVKLLAPESRAVEVSLIQTNLTIIASLALLWRLMVQILYVIAFVRYFGRGMKKVHTVDPVYKLLDNTISFTTKTFKKVFKCCFAKATDLTTSNPTQLLNMMKNQTTSLTGTVLSAGTGVLNQGTGLMTSVGSKIGSTGGQLLQGNILGTVKGAASDLKHLGAGVGGTVLNVGGTVLNASTSVVTKGVGLVGNLREKKKEEFDIKLESEKDILIALEQDPKSDEQTIDLPSPTSQQQPLSPSSSSSKDLKDIELKYWKDDSVYNL